MTRPRLDTIANLCVVVTCLLLSVAIGRRYIWDYGGSEGAPSTGYKRGEMLTTLEGVHFGTQPRTLVLFLSSKCKYCTESMPFYTKLAAARPSRRFQLVVAGSETQATLFQYLDGHGVAVDKVVTVSPQLVKVRATPTIVLVDGSGRVQAQWNWSPKGSRK
jgi:hypothetical protein